MFLKPTAVAVAAATGLWLWGAAPWDDGDDRWKPVYAQASLTHGEVIATGERDAWAFGWDVPGVRARIPLADGPHRPTAFHWNGARWEKSDLPVESGDIGSVAASSPSNVWALVGVEGGTFVLHWDGRAWTIAEKLPDMAASIAATADDVWVFGDHKAWHYNGTAWSQEKVPFHASQASARSASDIWTLDGDTPWTHHFDGRTWNRIDLTSALPKTPPPGADSPPGPHTPQLTAITADPSGVWITGEIGVSSFLLFQDGKNWRSEDTSAKAGRMIHGGPPVPDGRGGHWFLGSTDINGHDSALAHRAPSGQWTKTSTGGTLNSLTAVPNGPLLATGAIGKASGVFLSLL